jgi:large subunit ribosomal protein L24
LAVRAIDRETRRLDSIERGEPPPPLPASIPPDVDLPILPLPDVPTASHGPPRAQPKPRAGVRRPPAASPHAPVASQQVAPLPPPVEVRPAPGVARPPRPQPPLVLTPPAAAPARPAF